MTYVEGGLLALEYKCSDEDSFVILFLFVFMEGAPDYYDRQKSGDANSSPAITGEHLLRAPRAHAPYPLVRLAKQMAHVEGIRTITIGFGDRCSTIKLHVQIDVPPLIDVVNVLLLATPIFVHELLSLLAQN